MNNDKMINVIAQEVVAKGIQDEKVDSYVEFRMGQLMEEREKESNITEDDLMKQAKERREKDSKRLSFNLQNLDKLKSLTTEEQDTLFEIHLRDEEKRANKLNHDRKMIDVFKNSFNR